VHRAGVADRVVNTVLGKRFHSGDGHALDGIVDSPVAEDLALWDVNVWDGHSPGPTTA
jgi:hypothetical protein